MTAYSEFLASKRRLPPSSGIGRRAVGVELKPSYFRVAGRNLRAVEQESSAEMLFDLDTIGQAS